jgi:hypothetical protein
VLVLKNEKAKASKIEVLLRAPGQLFRKARGKFHQFVKLEV